MVNVAPAESVETKKTSTVLDDQHSCELVMLITWLVISRPKSNQIVAGERVNMWDEYRYLQGGADKAMFVGS
jgi:murein tripeptide amidase MpaA